MDRRTFLAATSAAAGSCFTTAMPTATAGQFTGKIKKAVKFQMFSGEGSVEDKFRMLQDCGFDGVETRIALGDKNRELVRSYARASEKTGLPIHGCVHSNNPTLVEAIDQAKSLGASSVLHVVGYRADVSSYLENYRETQEIIRRAVDHAEKHQVMILCENVWASHLIEPIGMARFIDEINSPMVGIYFDIGNVVRWGWPHHWLEVIGHRAKKLDVKEFDLDIAMNEGMRKGFAPPLGEGSIDWAKVREQLHALNYSGWATAEVHGGDRDRMAEIAEQMDRVLDL